MTANSTAAVLTVDVDAIVANYRRVQAELGEAEAAAVVKADCYGLGADAVVGSLHEAGCRRFFVARVDEGITLRRLLPEAVVQVFDGVVPGSEAAYVEHDLVPVVNSPGQLDRWRAEAARRERLLPLALHLDTGMRRLGLTAAELDAVLDRGDAFDGLDLRLVISHLASADEADSSQPEEQLAEFLALRRRLPQGRASFANSAGVFRGSGFHFDLARPGYALYGGHPLPDGRPNPMQPVVTLEAPVVQVRAASAGETVGYGASHRLERDARLATIAIGYADGFLRSASNRGRFMVRDQPAPIVGRVSMDLTTIDVTDIEGPPPAEGEWVTVIGPDRTIDQVAADAGTIGYEVLTGLGRRYHRRYRGASVADSPG